MLMAVRNQVKVIILSIKYAVIKEMLNKTTFITSVIFMMLNNAIFILQWIILFSLKTDIGGYSFKQILLLWGFSASTYGFSHFFLKKAYNLSNSISTGKLDAYLVQPKNVLLSIITSEVETSALGDMIYGYIMLFIYGFSILNFGLFTFFSILGGLIMTSIAIILGSLSFWIKKSDIISDIGISLLVNFSTYPDGIFKGIIKLILYTIIPIGIIVYIPVHILNDFNIILFTIIILVTILFIIVSFIIFYKGLKKYSSSNLMIARI